MARDLSCIKAHLLEKHPVSPSRGWAVKNLHYSYLPASESRDLLISSMNWPASNFQSLDFVIPHQKGWIRWSAITRITSSLQTSVAVYTVLLSSLRDALDACRAQGVALPRTTCCLSPFLQCHHTGMAQAGSPGCPCLHWPFSVVVWRGLPTHSWFLKQETSCSVFTRNILSGGTSIRTSEPHEKKILKQKPGSFLNLLKENWRNCTFKRQSTEELNHLNSLPTAIALPEGTFCYMQQLLEKKQIMQLSGTASPVWCVLILGNIFRSYRNPGI